MISAYSDKLPLGWQAPEFSLTGVDGQEVSLHDFSDYPALLVVFTCNHCPYARAAWPLLVDLYETFGRQVAFVAINANDSTEFPQDDYHGMQQLALEFQVPFPYLHDTQQRVASAFHAQCTPEPFLFANQGTTWSLFYHGRVNDNWQHPSDVTRHDLRDALLKVLRNDNPPSNQQPALGCSIKWRASTKT